MKELNVFGRAWQSLPLAKGPSILPIAVESSYGVSSCVYKRALTSPSPHDYLCLPQQRGCGSSSGLDANLLVIINKFPFRGSGTAFRNTPHGRPFRPRRIHMGLAAVEVDVEQYSFRVSSVFPLLSFVLASTSMLFWVIFLLPFFEHGRTI